MEVRELVSFYHVARLRSVSKAAEYLEIGQPTVTTHLQKIEREYGLVLFDRIKRPIQMTSEGFRFYELAKPIVEGIAEGIENLRTQMDYPEHKGSFIMGAYPDMVLHHLPPIIKNFRQNYPNVQIRLVARSYANLMEMVLSGELDIAIGDMPESKNVPVEFTHLFSSDFVVVTPLKHELLDVPDLRLSDIGKWPLITLGPTSRSRRALEDALRRQGIQYNITLEMDIMEMAKRYVEIGMGVSVTHDFAIQEEDHERLGIRSLNGVMPPSQMGLISLRGKFLSRSVKNFVEALTSGVDHLSSDRLSAHAI